MGSQSTLSILCLANEMRDAMNFYRQVVYTTPDQSIQEVKEAVQTNKLVFLSGFREDLPVHDFYSRLSETIGRIHAAERDIRALETEFDVRMVDGIAGEVPPGFQAWSTGIEAVDRAILEKVGEPAAFPVRSVTTTELRVGMSIQKTVSTLEVSNLR